MFGRFAGVLPCADCAGIRTDLRLYAEQPSGLATRYEATEVYLATRDGDRTFERSGRWTIMRGSTDDRDATIYQLDVDKPGSQRNFLRLGDTALRLLDYEQRDIPSLTPHSLRRVPDDSPADTVIVTEQDTGRDIVVAEGRTVTIRLTSNRSTGFSWKLVSAASDVLSPTGDVRYAEARAGPGAVGVGGIESWTFRAVRSGQQRLRFEYQRPWENAPPARSVEYTITVR